MNNYKIAFIHSDNFEEKGLLDGKVEFLGEITKDSLHVNCLLDYANQNFSEFSIFKKLSIRHQPEVVAYFLTKLGIVVFLNLTKYDEEHLRRYGKMGMIMLPDTLTLNQRESLINFAESISDFDISINYDLSIETGILDSKTIQGFNHEKPKELLDIYFKRANKEDSNIQKY